MKEAQQQEESQQGVTRLSSRQRKTKQEAEAGVGKRHRRTATKPPSFRTPERSRRHRRGGGCSTELLGSSHSKENIAVAMETKAGKENMEESVVLDPFGARPFHPQDPVPQANTRAPGTSPGAPGDSERMDDLGATRQGEDKDDFGAVPFTELVVGQRQGELDPFGAAPFPSKP